MNNTINRFKELHNQQEPLLLGNIWNAQSARIYEKMGFKAVATSSSAVAESLGYADGESMSFEEYLFIIERIAKVLSIPLSVDLEGGYGASPSAIAENIKHLYELGVAGINIEDSIVSNGKRSILSAEEFAKKIAAVVDLVRTSKTDLFINVRSDVFLLGLPGGIQEAKERAAIYSATGVNGLFFPCITELEEIRELATVSSLPLNVMCMPALPGFDQLGEAGVKRISMGNFLNAAIYKKLESLTRAVIEEGSFQAVFSGSVG